MKPLDGITILDLTHVLAGPFCTQSLQDLGARVIKVERPGTGDDTRAFPPFLQGESAYFATLNAGKQSIALDLKAEGITSIIWATGFSSDYGWLQVDAFDAKGKPKHQRGVSSEHGVYFLGLPWLSRRGSSFIWGVWHAPLILQGHNYPQHPQIGVIMMIVWCMLMGPIISYIRVKARSVIAAAIFHGTINGTYGLSIMLISGGNDLVTGMAGLAGCIVFAVAGIIIFIFDRRITRQPVNGVLSEL